MKSHKKFWVFVCLLSSTFHMTYAAPVEEITTKSGIKAWLIEEHAQPIVAVKILFKNAGSAYDPDGKEGRANLGADLLLEGAGLKDGMDSLHFHQALESKAISISTGVDEDHLNVSMETLSEQTNEAFSLLGLALTQPRFDEDAVVRMKTEAQTSLLQMEPTPNYKLARAWSEHGYGKHPYAKPAIGTKTSLTSLTRADFVNYHSHYITKQNMLIAVVGDITSAQLYALLDQHLSALHDTYVPDSTIKETSLNTPPNPVIIEQDIPQTIVSFGGKGIKRDDPKYFDAYVMNHILGGSGSLISRLGLAIREQKGLAYYVNTSLDPMQYSAAWSGNFATRNEQVGQAYDTLKQGLMAFRDKGATDKELTEAKQYLTGSFLLSLDSNSAVANFLIAMQLHHLGKDYLDKRNSLVEAVTKEGVDAMAKKLIDPDHMLCIMVGSPVLNPTNNNTK